MTAISSDLLSGYRPLPGAWDEMVDGRGRTREAWSAIAPALQGMGLDELARRRTDADRLLEDDGVTYHVYGEPEGRSRRWQLDPLPVVLGSDEWADIERGVIQRAELLNVVLTDLYGSRELVRRRLLPPALVLGHPGFIRACDQIRLPGTQQLFSCAVDLGRDADGTIRVLSDRTEAPSGAGYALENRVVTSRVLPSLYRQAEVHRLAPFFRSMRSALEAAAPASASEPRIVVLTPGSLSETSFEHAYLASYLGYPLVEGTDLLMRDGRVWLRSLGRREPVDVVLRRVDASYSDPLELRVDSHLGVPGLVEACRLGTVSVVNTLGSGVLENPALLAYLPTIAERVLGQGLRLPSVPTWWCGDDDGRRKVLGALDRLALKPMARSNTVSTVLGWELSTAELDDLRRRIEARPEAWVGQEPLALAAVPTLTGDGLEPRRSVLRAFAVARGESYAVMPGGLTRVAADAASALISNQAGALSKDTWVLASEPEPSSGWWLREGPAVRAIEPAGSMPSRAAENLFWLGRYAERAETVCRLLRVVHDRRNEFANGPSPAGIACVDALLGTLTHVTATYPGFLGHSGGLDAGPDAVGAELVSLTLDSEREGTLAHAVRQMVDAAHAVRDQLSSDTWLVFADLDRDLLGRSGRRSDRAALGRVMRGLLALAGLGAESMVRDPGWRFLEIGRRLERGLQLISLLRAVVTEERDTAADSLLLESVLTAAESIITYRRRYRSHAQLETVLDLLLLDPDNPRSLAYQVQRLTEETDVLPGGRQLAGRLSDTGRAVLQASTTLRLADTAMLARASDGGRRHSLDAFLMDMAASLTTAGDTVTATHFTHLLPQRPLGALAD